MPSLNEDTPTLDDNTLVLDEDLPGSAEYLPSQDQDTNSLSSHDRNWFNLFWLHWSGKRGCESCSQLLQYLIQFLGLWPGKVDDGTLFWHKGELRWRVEESIEEGSTRYHELRFHIFSLGEEEKGKNIFNGIIFHRIF
jgi:hypothetical protein